MATRKQAGYHLIELLIALAITGLIATVSVPPLLRFSARLRVELAAAEVASTLRVARSFAIRHNANVGLKFRIGADGAVRWALYRDADGDGVRTADIDAGVDPPVLAEQRLAHFGRAVRFGFPPGRAPRDPSNPRRRLTGLDDPIRFNQSDIASFSHLGTSTPGSVYITDGVRQLSAVRVLNTTGKVTRLLYDVERERWR